MQVIEKVEEMAAVSRELRRGGKTIGFVPTMGYLHEGHLSLVRLSKAQADVTVVSIFVNPTQFGPNEDLGRYPRDAEGDLKKCRDSGADTVFFPDAAGMYPEGYCTYVDVERVSEGLCGASRPGHFRGVATVVSKLFNIVKPDRAFFGQKDFQQTVVVRRMVRDLNMDVEVVVGPTMREPDGLAMSSRNVYLAPAERAAAARLYAALSAAKGLYASGERDAGRLKTRVQEILAEEPLVRPEYVEAVDMDMRPAETAEDGTVIAVAARIGNTRLIDNMPLLNG